MDAGERGAGADDDRARAGAVLRRPGAAQEHAGHHDAEFWDDGADQRAVGAGRVQPGVRRQRAGHRRLFARIPERRRRRSESGLCRDDSTSYVYDLPDDVRRDYAGVDHRRNCGAHEVQRHCAVHDLVVFYCVCAAGTHGLGQRWVFKCGERTVPLPGFRGWNRGAHLVGRIRTGLRAVHGKADRVSEAADATAQSGAEFYRRLFVVGRMVWI